MPGRGDLTQRPATFRTGWQWQSEGWGERHSKGCQKAGERVESDGSAFHRFQSCSVLGQAPQTSLHSFLGGSRASFPGPETVEEEHKDPLFPKSGGGCISP